MTTPATYLQTIGNEQAQAWVRDTKTTRPGVHIPHVYHKMTDGLHDAYAFAQIMYWSGLDAKGQPRLSHQFRGQLWIVKTYEEWCRELHFSGIRAVRSAFNRLVKRGLIIRERHKSPHHDTKTVLFIRVNWQVFGELLTVCGDFCATVPVTSEVTPEVNSEVTADDHSEVTPEVEPEVTPAVTALFTEITSKITSKTTSEITSSQTDDALLDESQAGEDRYPLEAQRESTSKPDDDDPHRERDYIIQIQNQFKGFNAGIDRQLRLEYARLGTKEFNAALELSKECGGVHWKYVLMTLKNRPTPTLPLRPLPSSAPPSPGSINDDLPDWMVEQIKQNPELPGWADQKAKAQSINGKFAGFFER
jgi:hypothetical protein